MSNISSFPFSQKLLSWAQTFDRPMPWKGEKEPYRIWLSEIILQQTRVEQGMPYYQRFIERYPTIYSLAAAEDDEVMRLWQGLGYYSRARNMLKAARKVIREHDGQFPEKYEDILNLPGVGAYTAAAIASFAFGAPHAVVDGNVMRVLARFFAFPHSIDRSMGKKSISEQAQALLDRKASGKFNQAMMDLGASICLPTRPKCPECPLNSACAAYKTDRVDAFPVRTKKTKRKDRYIDYYILHDGQRIMLSQRKEKDIWQELFEFVRIEKKSKEEVNPWGMFPELKKRFRQAKPVREMRHILSHQTLYLRFFEVKCELNEDWPFQMEAIDNLNKFAFPKPLEKVLKENFLYLGLD